MPSGRVLPALLALPVLSAAVTPLGTSLASDRGEELLVERLVVPDSFGKLPKAD